MPKLFDWMVLPAYCGLIFWLSAQEQLPMPEVFNFQDKVLHFGAYFMMAIFAWRSFRHSSLSEWNLALISFLFCSVYGMSDEWHQSFVLGRTSSIGDWLADSFGAAVAISILISYNQLRRPKPSADPSR